MGGRRSAESRPTAAQREGGDGLRLAIWLLPSSSVPPGTWLIGTGLILLALNAVRYLKGYGVNVLTTALGALAVAGGLADFGGVQLPLLAIALVAVGVVVLVRTIRGSPA